MPRPLVTIGLLACNEERYVEEAARSVLGQTYQPLQVILSDDASHDATFSIIERLAAEYGGPHQIVVNRNARNLGVGQHVNRVMELARGELFVLANADDVSLPHRVERTVEEWEAGGRKATSLYSPVMMIDAEGRELGLLEGHLEDGDLAELAVRRMPGVLGCSHAWSPELFTRFGPMLREMASDDRVLAFRAKLLGGSHRIADVLVRYRIHAASISRFVNVPDDRVLELTAVMHERNVSIWENFVRDLGTAETAGLVDASVAARTRAALVRSLADARKKIRFLRGGSSERIRLILSTIPTSPLQAAKWMFMAALPAVYIRRQRSQLPGI